MKATHHLSNQARRVGRSWRRWLLVIVLLIGLIFWRPPLIARPLAQLAIWLAQPVWWSANFFSDQVASWGIVWRNRQKMIEENAELKEQLTLLESRLLDYELLASENALLKDTLDWSTPEQPTYLGQIISPLAASPYDTLFVAVGEKVARQLRVGDWVFFNRAILLGEVVEIFSQTVKVRLLSSPGTRFQVSLGETGLRAEALGRGGGNFLISLPRGIEIKPGLVATVPEAGKNLVVAKVGAVDKEAVSSLQKVFLRVPLNLNQLRYVVIRSKT